jgi:hypothetical protein
VLLNAMRPLQSVDGGEPRSGGFRTVWPVVARLGRFVRGCSGGKGEPLAERPRQPAFGRRLEHRLSA